MEQIKYRTEAFSGSQVRDAAEVLAFETFELNNTDILENLCNTILKDPNLVNNCVSIIKEIHDNGYAEDFSVSDGYVFFREVLSEIKNVTGVEVNYALWLADKDAVTDREWYGKYMEDEADFESYEIGPIVLVDLGYDGTLYGYTELPISLETQIGDLGLELTDIIYERQTENISFEREVWLDARCLEIDAKIQEIAAILSNKLENEIKPSLDSQIKSASLRAEQTHSGIIEKSINREFDSF